MKNLNRLFKIGLIVKTLTLDLAVCVFGWQVTPTFNVQKPEPYGAVSAEVTGYVDMLYATGGVEWKALKSKFKNVWGVDFEMVRKDTTGIYSFMYDRGTEKVMGYSMADGSEVPDRTEITKCYFTAKGQR